MADETDKPNSHITDLKGRIRMEASAPTNPKAGDMYYNTTTHNLSYYTGTAWLGTPFT